MNNKDKTLFIVAAGLSTRFNGQPKYLAKVNDKTVIENTIEMARKHYQSIWVVLNEKLDSNIIDKTIGIIAPLGANAIFIPSGKGDADAVYQALIKSNLKNINASVCWGDAWFTNETIFETAAKRLDESIDEYYVFDAICANEDRPYGWFDVSKYGQICHCTFLSELSKRQQKVEASSQLPIMKCHDQCFFNINVIDFKRLYNSYLPCIESQLAPIVESANKASKFFKFTTSYEVSWYKMINWALYWPMQINPLPCSIVTMLAKPMARSFNTLDDLEEIRRNA